MPKTIMKSLLSKIIIIMYLPSFYSQFQRKKLFAEFFFGTYFSALNFDRRFRELKRRIFSSSLKLSSLSPPSKTTKDEKEEETILALASKDLICLISCRVAKINKKSHLWWIDLLKYWCNRIQYLGIVRNSKNGRY